MRRLSQILFIVTTVAVITVALLAAAQAAPQAQGRTNVNGIWGLAPTTYALTGTQTLTPTGSLYFLTPSAALTLTLSTNDAVPGDMVFFVSGVTTSTVFADTGATAGGSTRTLGNNDIIGFLFDGTTWDEAFFSDNS